MSELSEDEREALAEAIPGLLEDGAVADLDDDSTPDEVFRAVASNILVSDWLAEYVAVRTRAVEQEREPWVAPRDGGYHAKPDGRGGRDGRVPPSSPSLVSDPTARTRAVEQELTQVAEANRRRAVAAEQHLAELEAAVLALADELERTYPLRRAPWYAVELRALVSDRAVLDRVRQEAAEAALAPIEALAGWCEDKGDAVKSVGIILRRRIAAARDAAGRSGGEQ